MLGIENYSGFLLACIILNITPGNDTIYILSRSISQGTKAGLYSVYGIISGALIHTFFAAIGLSVLLEKSVIAFSIVKYLGVIYLVYLGIKVLMSKEHIFQLEKSKEKIAISKIYRQGFITNLLNPKVALFYLAFIPQFISHGDTFGALPFLVLGFTFMTTGTIWCIFLAYASSLVSRNLRENAKISRWLQKMSGIIFIGLGLKILFEKR